MLVYNSLATAASPGGVPNTEAITSVVWVCDPEGIADYSHQMPRSSLVAVKTNPT